MNNINWKSVLIAAVLILLVPILVNLIIGFGYSFIVGFQTRGDMDEIQRLSAAFSTSFVLQVIIWASIAAAAFWRGRKMILTAPNAPLPNALTAVVIGMLLFTILTLSTQGSAGVLLLVVGWVMALGGAYLGVSTAQ